MSWITLLIESISFGLLMGVAGEYVITRKMKRIKGAPQPAPASESLNACCIVGLALVLVLNIILNIDFSVSEGKGMAALKILAGVIILAVIMFWQMKRVILKKTYGSKESARTNVICTAGLILVFLVYTIFNIIL